MLERAQANDKITFLTNTAVTEVEGFPAAVLIRASFSGSVAGGKALLQSGVKPSP